MLATLDNGRMRTPGDACRWTRRHRLAAQLAGAMLGLGLAACQEVPDHCRAPCKRVAICKTEAVNGEPILGEKAPPPDKQCLAKCKNHPDDFAKCEGKMRLCSQLRNCRGSLRE